MRSSHPVSSWCRSCWKRAPEVAVVKVVSLFFFPHFFWNCFYFEDETLWSPSGGMVCSSTSRRWHGLKRRGRSRSFLRCGRWFRRDVAPGRTATCHCFMPWGIRHRRSSVTTRRISNRMLKSSLQVAKCFGWPQTSEINRNEWNAVA